MNIRDLNGNVIYHGYFTAANVWVENTSTNLADCLAEAVSKSADLTGADLRNMKVYDAINIEDAKLAKCSLDGAVFYAAVAASRGIYAGADMRNCDFKVAPIVVGCDFTATRMPMVAGNKMFDAGFTDCKVCGWSYDGLLL